MLCHKRVNVFNSMTTISSNNHIYTTFESTKAQCLHTNWHSLAAVALNISFRESICTDRER